MDTLKHIPENTQTPINTVHSCTPVSLGPSHCLVQDSSLSFHTAAFAKLHHKSLLHVPLTVTVDNLVCHKYFIVKIVALRHELSLTFLPPSLHSLSSSVSSSPYCPWLNFHIYFLTLKTFSPHTPFTYELSLPFPQFFLLDLKVLK